MLGEKFCSSVSVGDRVVVRVEANRHAQGGFALSVHKEGTADVAGRIGKEVSEPLVPFIRERGFQLVDWYGIINFLKSSSLRRMSRNGLFLVHSEVISVPCGSSTWAKKEVLVRASVLRHSSVEGTAVEDFVAAMKKAGCFEFKSVSIFFKTLFVVFPFAQMTHSDGTYVSLFFFLLSCACACVIGSLLLQ